jgi:hypothetical protein
MPESSYAFIKDNIVVNIVVFNDPSQELLVQFKEFHGVDNIVYCENNPKASIGSTYSNETFILPKPYPSWALDENYDWQPPVPMPVADGKMYYWSEESANWIETSI